MAAGQERRIEIKVGALIVVCLALMIAFFFMLSDMRFGDMNQLTVDWETSGGLKSGAPVKIAGMEAGRVTEVEFVGGKMDEALGRKVWVRVKLDINPERRPALREDATFYITTVGLLGEKYVEIDPGRSENPLTDEPHIGTEPMRIEVLTTKVLKIMDKVDKLIDDNGPIVTDTLKEVQLAVKDGRMALADARSLVGYAKEKMEPAIDKGLRVMTAAEDALNAYTPGKGKTGDDIAEVVATGKKIAKTVDKTLGDGTEIKGMLSDARHATKKVRDVVDKVGDKAVKLMDTTEKLIGEAETTMVDARTDLKTIVKSAKGIMDDVAVLVRKLRDGEGSVGALLNDREMFDDARELMKDLKRHPWKFLWKE